MFLVRVFIFIILLLPSICISQSLDLPESSNPYYSFSLFTSMGLIAGSVNYCIEKPKIGIEYGFQYPVFVSSYMHRSLLGNIGLNGGIYYHNKPIGKKLQLSLVARCRASHLKTESVVDIFNFWQDVIPPFYKFKRYWFETYVGLMLTKRILPRAYIRFEYVGGYIYEYKKNIDGKVIDYNHWTVTFMQHTQLGIRYDLLK